MLRTIQTQSVPHLGHRILLRVLVLFPLLSLAMLLSAAPLYADSVTIVDGPNTPPAGTNDVFNDAYIQNHLNTIGSLTIDTANSTGGGLNDITIEPGAEIVWTTNATLTLLADRDITAQGRIQHDGPADGSGGVVLRANDDGLAGGDVFVGLPGQTTASAVGSRHGGTHVEGANVSVQAGGGSHSFAQIGYSVINQGATYSATGWISVTASLSVEGRGGSNEYSYVQIGHGGSVAGLDADPDGTLSGDIAVRAVGDILFFGGTASREAYSQIGHGGYKFTGPTLGNHTVEAGGNIEFTGGSGWDFAYAQIGNGGGGSQGAHGGTHQVDAGGDILFAGGSHTRAYAQIGNGGWVGNGEASGDHWVEAGGDILFTVGGGTQAYVQIGNGGRGVDGLLSGNLTVIAPGDIHFTGSGENRHAQIGHGGYEARGNSTGNHFVEAGGEIRFTTAQIGNGGYSTEGNHSGSHTIRATESISFTTSGYGDTAHAGNGGYHGAPSIGHSGDITVTAQNGDIYFRAADGLGNYVQAGNGGYLTNGTHTGAVRLYAAGDITFLGGTGTHTYALAGNGGAMGNGARSGDIELEAGGDVRFTARGSGGLAQAGHGGTSVSGTLTGTLTITAGQSISFSVASQASAYAQAGHGGRSSSGQTGGDHTLTAGEDIVFAGGGGDYNAYAQMGNGGAIGGGADRGDHTLRAGGDILFQGGTGADGYSQMGNGGREAGGDHSGSHSLLAEGAIRFQGGSGEGAYTQVGNGGSDAGGNHSGNHTVRAGSDIRFVGSDGPGSYAQMGNGGSESDGDISGDHELLAGGEVVLAGGLGERAYVQVGNGGYSGSGNIAGSVTVSSTLTTVVGAGSAANAYAQIGHGDAVTVATGTRSGDITVFTGEEFSLFGARIGHGTADGANAITGANTYIAAGQNHLQAPSGTMLGAANLPGFPVHFNSAPMGNGGELRFYVPTLNSVVLPSGTPMNSEIFPGSVPSARMAGAYLFANGPYITDYSFYVANASDLGVSKRVEPTGALLPGQPITYTLAFSNSGALSTTNVLLSDLLPLEVSVLSIDSELDPGVEITQTGSAPALTWNIDNLLSEHRGTITVRGVVADDLTADRAFTNTVTIADGLDVMPGNNRASAVSTVVPPRISFAPATATALESDGTVWLTATLDVPNPFADVTVPYSSIDGDALAGGDYIAVNDTLTIPAGATQGTFSVALVDDAQEEPDEGFSVALGTPVGAVLGAPNAANVTIRDDDSTLHIAPLNADRAEGDSGTTPFTFVVNRTGYLTAPVTVDYGVSGGVNGADFAGNTLPSGSITLASGESSATITATVQGDTLIEGDEPFVVTLSNPSPNASMETTVADGTIRNDDQVATLSVTKEASVVLATVGETITYTYRITNSGDVPFVAVRAVDDRLGPVPLGGDGLAPGATVSAALTHTVQPGELPGPLVNTVTVTGTPSAGQTVVVTDAAQVDLVDAAFTLHKTVGIQGIRPECTDSNTLQVPISTTVVYCFTLTNTGAQTLTTHLLEDDHLGTVLDADFAVAPGATFSTTVTRTLTASVTNVALWTAGYPGSTPVAESVQAAALPAQGSAQATVIISGDNADQDADGIPDNVESADDPDGDNIPNFLDRDSDDDGRADSSECPSLPCRDVDADGVPDFLDPDEPTALVQEQEPTLDFRLFLPLMQQE